MKLHSTWSLLFNLITDVSQNLHIPGKLFLLPNMGSVHPKLHSLKRNSISNKLTYHLPADHVNSLQNSKKRQVVIKWDNSSGGKKYAISPAGLHKANSPSTHKTRNRSAAQQEISWVWQHVSRQGGSKPALVRQRATLC